MKRLTQLIRMTRKRLGCGQMKASRMVQLIRDTRPDAPADLSKADLFEWYCGVVFAPPTKRKGLRKLFDKGMDPFYASYEWRKLRMEVIRERGARCECCGANPSDGTTVINVDHIKPRKLFPSLALVKSNLQVLCSACNHGKGNWDQTDWRNQSPTEAGVPTVKTFDERGRVVATRVATDADVKQIVPVDRIKELKPRLVRPVGWKQGA